jgi:hypothetical protein
MSMDWSNERFVRFFTRDTVTWKRWSWEAKAVWGLVLRKLDRSGVIDTGAHDKPDALALIIEVPCEVARRVVPEYLASGSLVESDNGYCAPRFQEAQETPISDKQRQAESRANRRAANLRNGEDVRHAVSHDVTGRHAVSQPVTPDQTRPDQTSLKIAPMKPAHPRKSAEKPTDPRHAVVVADFDRAFRTLKGRNYPYAKADFRRITDLLTRGTPEELLQAWQRALHHQGFPTIATIEDFAKHLPRFIGTGPPSSNAKAPAPIADWSNATHGEIPA